MLLGGDKENKTKLNISENYTLIENVSSQIVIDILTTILSRTHIVYMS